MTNKRESMPRMGTVFKGSLWPHCDCFLALNILGSLSPMSIYLLCLLPLFWIARFEGWCSSRLTPTVRQMELSGARQRPGKPCQLIWPQAQPYSITTIAVIIQLKLVRVLFTVRFSRLLKMTVALNPLGPSRPGGYICPSWLCIIHQISLGNKAAEAFSHPRGSCTTGIVRRVLGAAVTCWLAGWCDWLARCSLSHLQLGVVQFMSVNFQEKEEFFLVHPPH